MFSSISINQTKNQSSENKMSFENSQDHAFAVSEIHYDACKDLNYEWTEALKWEVFGLVPQASMAPLFNMPNTYAEGAKMLEDCFTALYWLARSKTLTDVTIVLGALARAATGRSVVQTALASDLVSRFRMLFAEELVEQSSWNDTLGELRESLTKFEMVRNSQLMKKLHQILMYALSFGLCEKMGVTFDKLRYSRIEREAVQKDFTSTTNFLVCIADTLVFIGERGVAFMRTGRWTTMLHSGDKYEEWYERSLRVKEHAKLLNDPNVHGFDEPEFIRDIEEVMRTGKLIYEEAKVMSMAERRLVQRVLHEVRLIHGEFLGAIQARLNRDVPYSLLVTGQSSIGKSNITSLLFAMFAKWNNLPEGEEYIYTLMPNDEFWSGFKTFMWGLSLDDMGSLSPTLAEAGLDKMLMQVISIVNNVPYVTNQADLADKGTVPFRGQCVIATANTTHLNSQFVYTCPIAMLRRLPIVIEPTLKDEFSRDNMLDKAKARESGLEVPDFYNFKVSRVVPKVVNGAIDHKSRDYVVVEHDGVKLENVGLLELLKFLKFDIAMHKMNQAHVKSERQKFVSMTLCECHGLPPSLCMTAQVGERVMHEPEVENEFIRLFRHNEIPPPNAHHAHAEVRNGVGIQRMRHDDIFPGIVPVLDYRADRRIRQYFNHDRTWVIEQPIFHGASPAYAQWWQLFVVSSLVSLLSPMCAIGMAFFYASSPLWERVFGRGFGTFMFFFCREIRKGVHKVYASGWRPFVDMSVRNVVTPDSSMKRLMFWACAPAATYVVNFGVWTWVALKSVSHGPMHWVMCFLLNNLPLFLIVYLAPMFGVTWLAHKRVAALFRDLGRREVLVSLGSKVAVTMLTSLVAMRAATMVVAKIQSMINANLNEQAGEQSVETSFDEEAKVPEPCEADITRANVWYKSDYLTTPNDVGKKACGVKSMSPEEFAKYVDRNLVLIKSSVADSNKECVCRAIGIADNVYITNSHNFDRHRGGKDWRMCVIWTEQTEQVGSNTYWTVDPADMMELPNDLVLFRIPVRPPVKNILELFPSKTLSGIWNGYRIIREETGSVLIERRTGFHRDSQGLWESRGKPSYMGYCGSAYVVETPYGPQIVALHYLGGEFSPISKSAALNREDLQVALSDFVPLAVQGQGHPWTVGEVAPKSVVRYIDAGHLDVYGSVPSFSANKSQVTLSSTAKFFMSKGLQLEHGKPILRGWEPQRRAMLGVVSPKGIAPTSLIKLAVADYVAQIKNEVPHKDFSVIHMVDEKTAILGMPGIPHMERLAMSTSAGYPFNVPKRECINEEGEVTNMDVRAEIDRIKQCYANGERAYPIFNACYKDEPTAFKKIAMNKTRVFLISNLSFTIVCRQLLMGHIRFFTSHRFPCEMAIGINCCSEEWGELRDYLTHFGDEFCDDGDFAGFDASQGAPWLYGAFDILTELAIEAGASESYLLKLQCLKYDLIFAVVNWFGTLIQFTKQNPSGNSMTTQLNCLVISILMRCAYFKLRRERGLNHVPFRSQVRLIGYGDDSAQNVHPDAREFYNHIALERVLSEFGYEFTMAQKDAESVAFRPMSEIGFLKRSWRWDDDVKAWLAPLEKKSIHKSLLICMPSKSVCEQKRATDCLSSALREHFMHGRVEFENFRELAQECVAVCALEAYVTKTTLPTYEELQAQFYVASKHVYMRQGRVAPVQLTLPAAQTEAELLLVVQGGTCSKSVAASLSHVGVPRSRFSSMSSLDSYVSQTSSGAWVGTDGNEIRPANQLFRTAGAAMKASIRHLRDTHPENWVHILRMEQDTACMCGPCRPFAREYYGCNDWNCDVCLDMFGPTQYCAVAAGMTTADYVYNYNTDMCNPNYASLVECHEIDWSEGVPLYMQSGEQDVMDLSETPEPMEHTQVVTHFVDDTAGVNVEYPPLVSDARDGEHRDIAELKNFLSRPVLIRTINWAETDTPGLVLAAIKPWTLFLSNTPIKNRLHNYSGIACTLRLKIVVNASPFFHGSCLAAYLPYTTGIMNVIGFGNPVTMSQLPHVWVYPSAQQGGEIVCPFYYYHNWLELNLTEASAMGELQVRIVNQLQSANGVSGASVTMQVWAWAEDVKLMGPTTSLAMQSGQRKKGRDEYGRGPVSSVASAVSSVANTLSDVPIIGKGATAVREMADMVGNVASLFGFSKLPVLDVPSPMVPKPFANFASTDIGTTVEKLSLDTKNDLSIDPRIGGLPGDDELALQGLFARESYLTTFTYSTTNATDDLLFSAIVSPQGMQSVDATGPSPLYCPTPLQFFTSMFENWRGPIVYRFKIVATPFHQGRLRFTYDPKADISTNIPDYATVFNEVVDLANTSDFEIVVPYMQTIGWCRFFDRNTPYYVSNAPLGLTHTNGVDNGMVTIRAVTKLTAPSSSSTIDIQVFVRAGTEYEVANPAILQPGRTFLVPQSGYRPMVTMSYGDTKQIHVSDETPQNHEMLFLTNMGEKITSMRQLINRTNQGISTFWNVSGGNQFTMLQAYQTPFPSWYGYTGNGRQQAISQFGASTIGFNFCSVTPWHMLAACFAGMRGSMQWHYNIDSTSSNVVPSAMTVTRHVNSFTAGNYAETTAVATVTANNIANATVDTSFPSGGALTNTRTNTGLSVLAPFYNQNRFIGSDSSTGDFGFSGNGSHRNNLRLRITYFPSTAAVNYVRVDRYFSAGPDFQFLFFLAASPYWVLPSVTPA